MTLPHHVIGSLSEGSKPVCVSSSQEKSLTQHVASNLCIKIYYRLSSQVDFYEFEANMVHISSPMTVKTT